MNKENESENIMLKIAKFIVDKRKAFYLLFIVAIIYSAVSIPKVKINNDISSYLPESTETKRGIKIMDEEFKTFGTAQIMISNITFDEADKIAEHIKNMPHVFKISFENTKKYYTDSSALIIVSFDDVKEAPEILKAMEDIKTYLDGYDLYIVSEIGDDFSKTLEEEVKVILMIASIIIFAVLIFTSQSYLEIAIFLIVFVVAAILNMGTNYWFGEISFVTKSIAIVLQLALAVDYAIILCHRFTEEAAEHDPYDAIVKSLSKAIVEISSSSLTTIAGLFALTTMQFGIGMDMGVVLIKGILFSLITVFLLMPGLLLMFSNGIKKTAHRNFVPDISVFGILVTKTKYIIIPIFAIVFIAGAYFSTKTEYVFSKKSADADRKPANRIAQEKIDARFGSKNNIALIIPKGNYSYQKKMIEKIERLPNVVECIGLANIEVDDKYITDKFTPREFAELTDLDVDLARLLFLSYGISNEEYVAVFNNVDEYSVPLIDIFDFVKEEIDKGVINLDQKQQNDFDSLNDKLEKARTQLSGNDHARIIVVGDVLDEGTQTTILLEKVRDIAHKYYDDILLTGEPIAAADLKSSFSEDNVKISVMTALLVMLILLFTFRSTGLPVMLILTIQGSIFINFSFPYLTQTNIFFLSYLIVSSIQMGATIDYAILITNRYLSLKDTMDRDKATVEALNQSFPTVFTSGSILTSAGYLIGFISTDPLISSIGMALGRGTLISIILVLTVLPQILNVGDYLIEKSYLTINIKKLDTKKMDEIEMEGYIKGEVHGFIEGEIKGKIKGDINAHVESYEVENKKNINTSEYALEGGNEQ